MSNYKFNEAEMTPRAFYHDGMFWQKKVPIYSTPISPRENFRRMISHERPLWLPMSTDIIDFCPSILPDNVARHLVREYGSENQPEKYENDMFGLKWVYEPVAFGSMVDPSLPPLFDDANEWKEKVAFPDLDTFDWEGCAERNKGIYFDTEQLTQMWIVSGFYERLMSFMGAENALIALYDEEQQDAVKALFDRLSDFYIEMIKRFIAHFHVDVILLHDDWGSQRGPMFSLDLCREMIVPYLKKVTDFCHANNIMFNLHSCGKNELLVPAMVDAAVDMWEAQSINDLDMLVDKYGDKMAFGYTLPGLPEDISEKEAAAAGKAAAETYTALIKQGKAVFVGFRGVFNLAERAAAYRHSRMLLSE